MKHMSALHRQVQAGTFVFPGAAVAMESASPNAIAMEGMADKIKEGWESFKKRVSPTDHDRIVMKLAFVPKMREALVEAKSKLSQAKTDMESTKAVQKFTKELPVTASTADQLIREISVYTRRIDQLVAKAAAAKTPEAKKKVREEIAMEFSKKGNVADGMVFTKQQTLKLLDECIGFTDMIAKAGVVYMKEYEAERKAGGKTAMESFKSKIAMEGLEDVLSVALESAGGVIGGVFLVIAAIIVRICAIVAIIVMWVSIFTLNFLPAIIAGTIGTALAIFSHRMAETAGEMMAE